VRQKHWTLEDHVHYGCGGRILRCVKGAGPSPGGDPLYMCADCGDMRTGRGPSVLCWCGFSHRGNHHLTAYKCVSRNELVGNPALESAMRACGCDPDRMEISIVLEKDYMEIIK